MTLPADPLQWAINAFQSDRATLYQTYRDYIEGRHPLPHSLDEYRRAFGNSFDNFHYNRCATVVDAHADRMRVQGFGSPDDDERREARERGERTTNAQKTIAQIAQDLWDANDMDVREGQIDTEAFGMGDAYLLVDVDPETGEVYLWPQRADEMRVRYDDMRPGVVELAAKCWRDEDGHTRINLYFRDRIEKYRSTQKQNGALSMRRETFEQYTPEGEPWPVPLNLDDTVPVFHIPNNGGVNSYGVSELRDVLPLQDALNGDLMNQRTASVFAIMAVWFIMNYDASSEKSQQSLQNFKKGLTDILIVPPNPDGQEAKLDFLPPADMAQFDLIIEKWDVRIARVSGIPVQRITGETLAQSGLAKRIDNDPYITKIEDRQQTFGNIYARAMTYALRLMGVQVEPGDLRVNWRPAAPLSASEQWEMFAIKTMNGIPMRTALREMGYEPEQIDQIMEDMAEEQARRERAFNAGALARSMFPAGDDEGEA